MMTPSSSPTPHFPELELLPHASWEATPQRTRGLLLAINIPGYYSLPVRILALRAMADPTLRNRFDIRFLEWDNPIYVAGPNKPELRDLIELLQDLAPELVGFSMNIWNRDACIEIARALKSHHPNTCIVVGGQEVTNSVTDYLKLVPDFDYLIDGEGELPFNQLLQAFEPALQRPAKPERIAGLHYRNGNGPTFTGPAPSLKHLDENPSIILADLVPVDGKNKLGVLLESSRGCPNRCGFCFEGAKRERIRTASSDRLGKEMAYMAAKGARYFHVMDPILCNSNVQRLAELAEHFRRLKQEYGQLSISVETYADQISEEVAGHLAEFSMLDIGLQSINPPTLQAIHRRFHQEKFVAGIERIRPFGSTINIYLILGLPFETAATFFAGLFFALSCRPTQIFINELLLLNGTDLRERAEEFRYVYDHKPPYTVHATNALPRRELALLKTLAKNIEHRYNLNHCILSAPTPWRPRINQLDRYYHRLVLEGGCSRSCTGCSRNNDQPEPLKATAAPADSSAANIELCCGDQVPVTAIIHAAAQARLAGALRIKLTAPAGLFAHPGVVERLVNAGIHLFHTFVSSNDPHEYHHGLQQLEEFHHIRRSGVASGGQRLFPHLQISLLAEGSPHSLLYQQAAELGTKYGSLIELTGCSAAETEAHCQPSALEALHHLIRIGMEQRFALLLPPPLMTALLAESPEQEAVMTALTDLGLLASHTEPPCTLRPCPAAALT